MKVLINQGTSFVDNMIGEIDSELEAIDRLIDWSGIGMLMSSIKSDYNKLSLLKMLVLQTWHNMSDMAISKSVQRDIVFMRFCGFSIDGRKPNEATLCRFRNKLVKNKLWDKILKKINIELEKRELKVSNGKYVTSDATLISSSRRPRKTIKTQELETNTYEAAQVEYSEDKDASWVKKGKKIVYGYKDTIITDENGYVEDCSVASANKSEMADFSEVIRKADLPKGKRVLYDKGVSSKDNQEVLIKMGLKDGIMRKKPRGKEMPYWEKRRNKIIGKWRYVVERTFGTFKRTYGFSRTRYLGVDRVHGEAVIKAIAYNLRRALGVQRLLPIRLS